MGKVYLHIGTMKSGTTFLQRTLDRNVDLLASAGLSWPGARTINNAILDLRRSKRRLTEETGDWDRVVESIRSSPGDAIMSMELLGPMAPTTIRRLGRSFEGEELSAILTCRDLTRVVPSHWQETTQNRRDLGWRDYCDQVCTGEPEDEDQPAKFWLHHDVMKVIRRWEDLIPEDRFTIVTVPASSDDPSLLWHRFAWVLGIDVHEVDLPPRGNEALGALSAELMLRLNARTEELPWPVYRWGFKAGIAKDVLARRAALEPRYGLTPAHHEWLRRRALLMRQQIERSSVRVVGDLDDLLPPVEPRTTDFEPEQVTAEALLEAALDGYVGVGKRLAHLRQEIMALQAELQAKSPKQPN